MTKAEDIQRERDFKKAFEYFSKLMEKGDPVATYKIADIFFKDAAIDDVKLTTIYDELYAFRLVK